MALRESSMALCESERVLEVLLAILARRINDIWNLSASGRVSRGLFNIFSPFLFAFAKIPCPAMIGGTAGMISLHHRLRPDKMAGANRGEALQSEAGLATV